MDIHFIAPSPVFLGLTGGTVLALRWLRRYFLLFSLAALLGTLFHELSHFLAAFATGARPVGVSLIPRREGDRYVMGSVEVQNARWWNCTVIGMAPVTLIAAAYWMSLSRYADVSFSGESAAVIYFTASLVHGSVPSPQDFKVAFGSPGVWVVMGLVALYISSRYFR